MTSRSGCAALIARVASWIDALVVPRARALLVLVRRQAEQQNARDAERGGLAGLLDGAVDRQVVDARHRRDRGPALAARDDEHRVDQVVDRQLGLAHEAAQETGAPEAPQAGGGKAHGPESRSGEPAQGNTRDHEVPHGEGQQVYDGE